jgi:O-antigen/teichoic acid export membrane protein
MIKNIVNKLIALLNRGKERSVKAKKNILLMLLVKGLSLILSLLFVPLFLNCLDTIHYGIWVTILTLVNWIGFFDLGIGQGVRNKLAESLAKNDMVTAKSYVSTAYISVALIFFLLIGIFLITSNFVNWSFLVNPPLNLISESNKLIIIVVCIMCINFIVRVFNSVLLGMQMPAISSISDLISQGICVLIVFIISKSHYKGSLITFGLIMTIVPTFVSLVYSFIYFGTKFKSISPSIKYFDKGKIRSILVLGGSFFVIQMTWIMLTQTNNIIIANTSGPTEVASYFVAFRYMTILLMIFTILTMPIWSATTEAYYKNDIEWIRKTVKFLLILLCLFALVGIGMVTFSNFAFKIWIKNRIPVSLIMLILIFAYVIIQMLWSIFGSVINGIGKLRVQLYATIICAAVHIPLAFFLGKKMGAIGVVLSLVIVSSSILIWSPYQYNKLLNKTALGIWNK